MADKSAHKRANIRFQSAERLLKTEIRGRYVDDHVAVEKLAREYGTNRRLAAAHLRHERRKKV